MIDVKTYRSSVCRSDNRIDIVKAGVLRGRRRRVVDEVIDDRRGFN